MTSAIYLGQVKHRRMAPVVHEFSYRMFMMYLDLSELPRLFEGRWFWSARRTALARFRREDHFGDPAVPLTQSVQDLVERETGSRPAGPIRLLTQLRYFGFVFNPVSFYYCFDKEDRQVETIVAEVNNTPWGEQHCYVLPRNGDSNSGKHQRFQPEKVFHVSPFMGMDVAYDWRFNEPGDLLTVYMQNQRQGDKVFDATLALRRKELNRASLARMLLSFPPMTLKIIGAIYWQALRLWLKGAPVHDYPGKQAAKLEDAS